MSTRKQLTVDVYERSLRSSEIPASVTLVSLSDVAACDMTLSRKILRASQCNAEEHRWRQGSAVDDAVKLHVTVHNPFTPTVAIWVQL